MSLSDRYAPSTGLSRNAVIALSVVTLHVAALWALQSGLMRKAAEIIIPAEVLSEFLTPQPPAPPAPPTPPAPPPPKPAPPKPSPTPPKPRVAKPTPAPEPMPVAIADPTPAPAAPVGVVVPQPAAKPVGAPVAPGHPRGQAGRPQLLPGQPGDHGQHGQADQPGRTPQPYTGRGLHSAPRSAQERPANSRGNQGRNMHQRHSLPAGER